MQVGDKVYFYNRMGIGNIDFVNKDGTYDIKSICGKMYYRMRKENIELI